MKIKVVKRDYEEVIAAPKVDRIKPPKQNGFMRQLMYWLSISEIKAINFKCEYKTKLKRNQPYLFLMNHSSFTDLQIASKMLRNRPYHIVCTNDGLVGKEKLMRSLGCIPAKKFITDVSLVKDMRYVTDKLKSSVLMFPEASYSFDGTQTPLPDSLGKCVKLLNIPVVMIKTSGAYLRDPLYNNLQKRAVDVTATVECIITPDDIAKKSSEQINAIIAKNFEYDHFRDQVARGVEVSEGFRADGLHRALFKCPACEQEGTMVGKGTTISCECGCAYSLGSDGRLKNIKGEPKRHFEYIPDWYKWERECVKKEIEEHKYLLDTDVDIKMYSDFEAIYDVGEGHLTHDENGFCLTGCDGKLEYKQSTKTAYSLYADYYWYELGDMICIGDQNYQYYCFPKDQEHAIVAKARLATEEMFKM